VCDDDIELEFSRFVEFQEQGANAGLILRSHRIVDLVRNPRDMLLYSGVPAWVLLLNQPERGLNDIRERITVASHISQADAIETALYAPAY
jgi:hypothetical protein